MLTAKRKEAVILIGQLLQKNSKDKEKHRKHLFPVLYVAVGVKRTREIMINSGDKT